MKTQMGEIKSDTSIGAYSEFDGLKIPSETSSKIGPITQVAKMTKIEINPEIDPAVFALPEPITKLKK